MVIDSISLPDITAGAVITALQEGVLTLKGRFRSGSNYAFLVKTLYAELRLLAVYKPTQGERPLWDFPHGTLGKREVAAYVASEIIQWDLVPPTVYRDGPLGLGSVQYYVSTKASNHYFNFRYDKTDASKHVAIFDYIINNADRKGSHVVCDDHGEIWLLDHGICFHEEYKLRTVIWDFSGMSIPDDIRRDLLDFRATLDSDDDLVITLRRLLTSEEFDALVSRTDKLIRIGQFPEPGPGPNYPWPPM